MEVINKVKNCSVLRTWDRLWMVVYIFFSNNFLFFFRLNKRFSLVLVISCGGDGRVRGGG